MSMHSRDFFFLQKTLHEKRGGNVEAKRDRPLIGPFFNDLVAILETPFPSARLMSTRIVWREDTDAEPNDSAFPGGNFLKKKKKKKRAKIWRGGIQYIMGKFFGRRGPC